MLSLCRPLCVVSVTDWRPVQRVSCLLPDGSWDLLRFLHDPEKDAGMEKECTNGLYRYLQRWNCLNTFPNSRSSYFINNAKIWKVHKRLK